MVYRNDLGRVRISCDREGCERKFIPKTPRTDFEETRRRAELYGWLSVPGDGDSAEPLDICPADRELLRSDEVCRNCSHKNGQHCGRDGLGPCDVSVRPGELCPCEAFFWDRGRSAAA